MSLERNYNKLNVRLDLVEGLFLDFRGQFSGGFQAKDWMFLEGLLSTTWQYWAHFCRAIVVESCLGSCTSGGVVFSGCVTPSSWERVSYVATAISKNKNPKSDIVNFDLWKEPTWGDVEKLQAIVGGLAPYNKSTLVSSFGASTVIKHVQIVRNASAHRHRQNLNDVLSLAPLYDAYPLRHPIESTLWLGGSYKQPAFLFWLDEMRLIGELAIK